MSDTIILFNTTVGSHMWGMNTPESDIDEFQAYIIPTTDILKGIHRQNSHFTAGDRDQSRHEIGVVIEQLIKGNCNFVQGVTSSIVNYERGNYLSQLREIVHDNLSTNMYFSINGLAKANYQKYMINRKETWNQKRINTICRTINSGISILRDETISYEPYHGTIEDIPKLQTELLEAKENSRLQNKPDENVYREFLLGLRETEYNGDLKNAHRCRM